MKKLIAVAMLLSVTLCSISSCEDQIDELETNESQIEHAKMPRDQEEGSGHDPDRP